MGVGASRVRDLFEQGKKNAPCIVFIDEIDAVGRHRGAGLGVGTMSASKRSISYWSRWMGSSPTRESSSCRLPTVQMCSTPRCFGRDALTDGSSSIGRRQGTRGDPRRAYTQRSRSRTMSTRMYCRGTSGFSGADLANLVNEAALNAARYNQKVVQMADFEFAKDKVLMGSERRSMIISDEEKNVTAVHEAGHALLTVLLPQADPIHKVTIIPRGMALGLTQQLPLDDKHNYSREYLDDQIAILLGGRIAEEITQDDITTGAGNDLDRVDRPRTQDGVRVGYE